MTQLFGILLMIAGAVAGLYFGLWWAFIGGIVDVIREIRATEMDAMNLAIGIAKVLFSSLIGWFSACVLGIPGYAMLQSR